MATRRDAGAELEYAAELINAVVAGFEDLRTGVHVCRGNWSKRDDVLLTGDYAPLVPTFDAMRVSQLVLEFATPRAGDLGVVGATLAAKEIGLGVVNPRTDVIETPEAIVARAEEALRYYRPDQVFLNPDCGFACFANRCVSDDVTAAAKLQAMAHAARRLREMHA